MYGVWYIDCKQWWRFKFFCLSAAHTKTTWVETTRHYLESRHVMLKVMMMERGMEVQSVIQCVCVRHSSTSTVISIYCSVKFFLIVKTSLIHSSVLQSHLYYQISHEVLHLIKCAVIVKGIYCRYVLLCWVHVNIRMMVTQILYQSQRLTNLNRYYSLV